MPNAKGKKLQVERIMRRDIEFLKGNHDLSLSDWGPYTKDYAGISHCADRQNGLRFDISLFPGIYRVTTPVPCVRYACGHHPWEASPELDYFSYRHELSWKDKVYCDVQFHRIDEAMVVARSVFQNAADLPVNLVQHLIAYLRFPPLHAGWSKDVLNCQPVLPAGAYWVDALMCSEVRIAGAGHRHSLVHDGHLLGECRLDGAVGGSAILFEAGNQAMLHLDLSAMQHPALLVRGAGAGKVRINGKELQVGDGFEVHRLDAASNLHIEGMEGRVFLDGVVIAEQEQLSAVAFKDVEWGDQPQIDQLPDQHAIVLSYPNLDHVYGIAYDAALDTKIRTVQCRDLDSYFPFIASNHVSSHLTDRAEGGRFYVNIFQRPLFLKPGAQSTFETRIYCGSRDDVMARIQGSRGSSSPDLPVYTSCLGTIKSSGEAYRFSQERMAATTLTNVVFPVRTRGQWIRHYTPGRWWDCLYTWDSGFIGIGMTALDIQRAIEVLNTYVTEPDEPGAAFIHHGSPVPVQFFLFSEIWNRTQDCDLLHYFFPRLRQYHRFLAGRYGSSNTRMPSGFLRTWDYFYNSGGWDDYPPQEHVHTEKLATHVVPIINTALAIRTARIMKQMAIALGEDVKEFDDDIALFSRSLQEHAWDEDAGYFGYVVHDDNGMPTDILRHESGQNFNRGLDGLSPLHSGMCTQDQTTTMVENLMDENHHWTSCGLSTVDRSAAYYRQDGYWNGAVWMPHQWFFWKSLIGLGYMDEAYAIAERALDVWKREVDASYNCFEHFIVETGRGAGWHQFGGLSAPVLNWFTAYHQPGQITFGWDVWPNAIRVADDQTSLQAELTMSPTSDRPTGIIVSLAAGKTYHATWQDMPLTYNERLPGTLELCLPAEAGTGILAIRS